MTRQIPGRSRKRPSTTSAEGASPGAERTRISRPSGRSTRAQVHGELVDVLGAELGEPVDQGKHPRRLDLRGTVVEDVQSSDDPVAGKAHLPVERLGQQALGPLVLLASLLDPAPPLGRDRERVHRVVIGGPQVHEIGHADRPDRGAGQDATVDLLAQLGGGPHLGRWIALPIGGVAHGRGPSARCHVELPPGGAGEVMYPPSHPTDMAETGGRPLVVGSGIAGLYVALRARELGLHPTIVTKATLDDSNTRYAQGGIAAAIGPEDSPARHLEDTVRAGGGLVDRTAARILVEEAPRRIADLVRFGVPFDTVEGQIALGREAAHSRTRILHAGGDATGLQIEETLKRRAIAAGVETRERTSLRRLFLDRSGRLNAVLVREGERGGGIAEEGPVVLATGGAGSLYRESSNPAVATGEGVAVAARAGALIVDMEFMQFHPTVFFREGAPRFLLTEALRGEGALLRNELGERFLPRYHPDAELAPRDIVSRAIHSEMERTKTRCVYLDATAIPRDLLFARFPTVSGSSSGFALDPSRGYWSQSPRRRIS